MHELGQLAIAPPRIQRWSAPDMEWLDWTARDAGATAFNAVESLPGFGNSISGLLAAGELGRAGFDSLMGSDKDVAKDLSDAEDEALNAIPIFGNIRAAGRAGQDAAAVSNDFAGVAPENNPTAESDWARGGQQRFNESASRLWHDFLP